MSKREAFIWCGVFAAIIASMAWLVVSGSADLRSVILGAALYVCVVRLVDNVRIALHGDENQ